MQNYSITMLCQEDDTLTGYEIKVPEKVLEIFTPNAIETETSLKTGLKIIPSTDNFIVKVSAKICERLYLNPYGALIRLVKISDTYKFGYWTCDFIVDRNLEKNTIILPAERLKNNFSPDFICLYPIATTPIDCTSLNIQTSEEPIGRVSKDLFDPSLLNRIQLYLYLYDKENTEHEEI